jgi:hypothetical protein
MDERDVPSQAVTYPPLTGSLIPEPGGGDLTVERATGRTVRAEWALWGKQPSDPEYGVLRCSRGAFGPGDFHKVITRYTPGTKDALPQYTVCWIPGEDGREGHLGVAIHELADPDPERSGGRVRAARGREIEYIRFFCVRYGEMAGQQVGYAELVESVRGYQLPSGSTDPITVDLLDTAPPPFSARSQALAENVATLLLTTRPLCVLGADKVAPEERLWFIDQVMSLLPYGLRATMSASTWASPTALDLKLRLFFSSAERDDGGVTTYAGWDQPVRLEVSGPGGTLRHYMNWLERGGAAATVELAGQAAPVRFDPDEIRQMIVALPRDRPARDVLDDLAYGLDGRKPLVIQAAVRRLRQRRARPQSPEELMALRQEIKRLELLQLRLGVHHGTQASVFRVLLELAYGPVLTYTGFCEIEGTVGGPPRGMLAREMLKLKFGSYLPWLLTYRAAAAEFTDRELVESLRGQGVGATTPITEFCRDVVGIRPAHRPLGYDFAVRYLRANAPDPRAELIQRGYLTGTLEQVFPHDLHAQRIRLKETLVFVHGGILSPEVSAELLARPDIKQTRAFAAAVDELTARPVVSHAPGFPARLAAFRARVRGREASFPATGFVVGVALVVVVVFVILADLLLQHL